MADEELEQEPEVEITEDESGPLTAQDEIKEGKRRQRRQERRKRRHPKDEPPQSA
jgi:hypothetical protein